MTAGDGQPGYLLVEEAAALMEVPKHVVYRMIHAGQLDAVRIGRSLRIPASAVGGPPGAGTVGRRS